MEGVLQTANGVDFVFYNQLGGDMKRVDVFNGYKITDINEYVDFDIVDSCLNGDRTTYYIKPSLKNKKMYTDTTGVTYKTSSMYVYTDKNGNYRTFSDDTKNHLEKEEKRLSFACNCLEKEQCSPNQNVKNIDMYKRWIKDSKIRIEKLKKDLMKGF